MQVSPWMAPGSAVLAGCSHTWRGVRGERTGHEGVPMLDARPSSPGSVVRRGAWGVRALLATLFSQVTTAVNVLAARAPGALECGGLTGREVVRGTRS